MRLFFSMGRHPPGSTLFPYTTLFRSCCRLLVVGNELAGDEAVPVGVGDEGRPFRVDVELDRPLGARPNQDRGQAGRGRGDRKSTRLNSSHTVISYAVFCLKKKTNKWS